MVTLHLSAEDYARLASLGVVEKDGVLQSASGREVSAGTAVSLLAKVLTSDYPNVAVTFGPMPDPEAFNRPHLVAGHAAENATSYTVGVPPGPPPGTAARARAEHDRPPEFAEAFKGKKGKRARRAREAEAGAVDEMRTHVEAVKAATVPHPEEFRRGYLTQGHQCDPPANTGVRGTTPLPPSNDGVLEPQHVDRPWLTQDHQEPSPGDQGDNSPAAPGSPGSDFYDAGESAYNANRSASTAAHIASTGRISSEPAVARWEPSPGLGASSMPQPVSTSALPIGRAPGE